jgi:DNA-directed RNA polymerase subunit N (RpoN/RPB10)
MKSILTKRKEKAQKVFNEWVRINSCLKTTNAPFSCICFTCGREVSNSKGELHASHYILDSKNGNATSFDEVNVQACCRYCNRYLHGNLGKFAVNLIKKYGQDEIDRLESLKLKSKKWTIMELDEIHDTYKEKLKHIYD